MGLFLYVTGPVNPTETSVDELAQRCEGANNQSYVCESGHCCGVSQCCSYYYELWWFWLVWAIIFILSCCCVCHHRRTKHRLQQQQRQHEINLIAYREAHNYTSPPFYFRFLPNYLLPEYEEAMHRPATPPPPYSALNAAPTSCSSPDQQEALCPSRQPTPVPSIPSSSPCPPAPVPEEFGGSGRYGKNPESKSQTGRSERSDGSERVSVPTDEHCDSDKQETRGKAEDKERGSGRRRRFTGDSGIEVCVCAGGPECRQPKELESLLSGDEDDDRDDSAQFCRGCGLPECEDAEEEEEEDVERGLLGPDRGADNRNSPLTQPHPVCLYLQTINEQEGSHCGDAEPQN